MKKLAILLLGSMFCAIHVSAAELITNGSFENVPFPMSGDGTYCFMGNPFSSPCAAPLPGWSGGFIVLRSNSAPWFSSPNTPSDLYEIGLQSASSISQTVNIPTAGNYELSWSDAGRRLYGTENYQVSLGGVILASLSTAGGQSWSRHTVTFFANPGLSVLSFVGSSPVDATAFIDNVSLAPVPEPATTSFIIGGLLALVFKHANRRRDVEA